MPVRSSEESSTALGPVGEGEWQRLRRQFELATDPWLGFIFCPAPGPVAALRERTEFTLRYRARQMRRFHPASPDELRELMPRLFASLPNAGCVWVEVVVMDSPLLVDDVGPWASAWDWLMLRLNERRDALRRRLAGPLIIAVHPEWKPRLRDAAPDIWSVRSLVLDLPGNEGLPAADRSDVLEESKVNDDAAYVASVEEAQAALHRLEEEPLPDAKSLARLHMYTASALLADGRASEAPEHADRALANATANTRLRAQALAVAARAKLQADGDVAAALQHLQEAIRAWRSILSCDGETPQTLRDLSISLDRIGRIYEDMAETDVAKAAYMEALEIRRHLVSATGETSQALRDLSVSLERMGGIHEAAGEVDTAHAAYEESLAIDRRLMEMTGETPQALRDLSVSLERMGGIHETAGDAAAAKAAYEEASTIRQRLVESIGEIPQTLRDLSVSLSKMGGIYEAAGETDAAKAAYEESLANFRRMIEMTGETPQTLRDLSVSLGKMGGVHEAAGETDAARAAYEESLAIVRRSIEMIGETPQTRRDLSISHNRLDRLKGATSA